MVTVDRILRGQCLCGAIRYTVDDGFSYALNCHCSQCRRATGSAFKPFGGIERDRLRIDAPESVLLRYGDDDAHDLHCRCCGSLLASIVRGGAYAHVTYGTLLDAPSLSPTAHIFVGSKAPWFEIRDGLPQFPEFN